MQNVREVQRRSIVHASHKPVLPDRIVKNPVHTSFWIVRSADIEQSLGLQSMKLSVYLQPHLRRKNNLQIPFVIVPTIFPPPVSRTSPRARRGRHFSAHSSPINSDRTSFL